MNVIGIDPSLTATGVATADQTLTITTQTAHGDLRLTRIHDVLDRLLHTVTFDLAVVEDLPTHAHGAGKTGMAQGVVRLTLAAVGVPYALATAATLKKLATGKGTATKADMRMALYQRAGLDIRDDDQVDAVWLREMGLHHLGQPTIALPKTHLAALGKVTWPALPDRSTEDVPGGEQAGIT